MWGCVWKRLVHGQTQTVGCFPSALLFLSNQSSPSLRKVFYFLWLESGVWRKSAILRQGRQPSRGRETKLTPSKNATVFKMRALMFAPLPEACQTQGFEKERKKKIWFVLKGAKNNLALSCRRKQKTLRFPPIWMFFSLGCGRRGEPLSSGPGRRQQAKTLRQGGGQRGPGWEGAESELKPPPEASGLRRRQGKRPSLANANLKLFLISNRPVFSVFQKKKILHVPTFHPHFLCTVSDIFWSKTYPWALLLPGHSYLPHIF